MVKFYGLRVYVNNSMVFETFLRITNLRNYGKRNYVQIFKLQYYSVYYTYDIYIYIYINHIEIQIKPFCILFFTLLLIVPKYYRSLSHSLTLSLSLLATMLINSSNILFSWCEIIQ